MNSAADLKDFLKLSLKGGPFEGKTFYVGGSVRDEILGEPVKDYDLVVEELGGAKKLAWMLHAAAPKACSRPHQLGSGYPIWQIVFKDNLEISTRWYHLKGLVIEIADTQKEAFPNKRSRARVTSYGNIKEDCERRDFTVNMLYQNVVSGEIIDPSGCGRADISHKLLRTHPEVEAAKIFSDDPLRMIRMVRFQTRFSWAVDKGTWDAAVKMRERLEILSSERVRDELIKIMERGQLSSALRSFQGLGFLKVLWPEFLPMIGCEQDKIYHSEGDVWTHTLMVIDEAPKDVRSQLTALLHDIGKPATQSRVGDRIKFLKHEEASCELALKFLKKWKFPTELGKHVVKLVALHLRGGDVAMWKTLKPARKLIRDAGILLEPLLQFIEADSRASRGADGKPRLDHIPMLQEKLRLAEVVPIVTAPVLSGHEIMKELGIKPGKSIKTIQRALEERSDLLAESGEVFTRERAIEWLRQSFDAKTLSFK